MNTRRLIILSAFAVVLQAQSIDTLGAPTPQSPSLRKKIGAILHEALHQSKTHPRTIVENCLVPIIDPLLEEPAKRKNLLKIADLLNHPREIVRSSAIKQISARQFAPSQITAIAAEVQRLHLAKMPSSGIKQSSRNEVRSEADQWKETLEATERFLAILQDRPNKSQRALRHQR